MSLHRIPIPMLSKHESSAGLTYLCIRLIEYHEEYDNSETTNAISIKYLRFFDIVNYFDIKKPEELNKCLFII